MLWTFLSRWGLLLKFCHPNGAYYRGRGLLSRGLTIERAYYRARTVRVVLIKETYSLIKHSLSAK